ncbi:hypothetical protein A1OE_1538 [Candidatus Endolissoclinum faulkneri L2]|uniref:Uncharacterized protein n=1 Tax=Candidatus Endolissoclinum faulkneri L2 TaxID=1193729 RepID=K7ZDP2_9PROT|nr:hypothetical protein A1OE_1538 [Candidatus Endolissoclinum faulkneri L2]
MLNNYLLNILLIMYKFVDISSWFFAVFIIVQVQKKNSTT